MDNPRQPSNDFSTMRQTQESVDVENTLEIIRSAQVRSHDEYMTVLQIIQKVKTQIGPTATLLLHFDASLKLYNSTKDPREPTKSIADAVALMQAKEGRSFHD